MKYSLIAFSLCISGSLTAQSGNYDFWVKRFEAAKKIGDFSACEDALQRALTFGKGDEYIWRSLAWSQMHQGKWKESLQVATENVKRNGACDWSYLQLFESYMAAGQFTNARKVLEAAPLLRNKQGINWTNSWKTFTKRTCARDIEISIVVLEEGHRENGIKQSAIPLDCERQKRLSFEIDGGKDCKIKKVAGREVATYTVSTGRPVTMNFRFRFEPILKGAEVLQGSLSNDGAREYLGPFIHGGRKNVYDPTSELIKMHTARFANLPPKERVDGILKWFKDNFKYELGHPDDMLSTLERRKGQCHHYCGLFSVMSRSVSVPSNILHVTCLPDLTLNQPVTFNRKGDPTMAHGQNEVWLGSIGWVPLEPQNPTSFGTYENNYLLFDRSGNGPNDNHWEVQSLQGYQMTAKWINTIPRV